MSAPCALLECRDDQKKKMCPSINSAFRKFLREVISLARQSRQPSTCAQDQGSLGCVCILKGAVMSYWAGKSCSLFQSGYAQSTQAAYTDMQSVNSMKLKLGKTLKGVVGE